MIKNIYPGVEIYLRGNVFLKMKEMINLKRLMIIKAIVCLGLGIPMLLIPVEFMSLYGLNLISDGIVMTRMYGGALFGILLLTWFCRSDTGSISLYAAVFYLFVYDGINFFVTLWATLSGIMGVWGWSVVAIYLFFTVGFGYFLFGKLKVV